MKTPPTDPIEIFRHVFPKAYVGMVYADLVRHHITDNALWYQVLRDVRDEQKAEGEHRARKVRIPWLIEEYRRMGAVVRELAPTGGAQPDAGECRWGYREDENGDLTIRYDKLKKVV